MTTTQSSNRYIPPLPENQTPKKETKLTNCGQDFIILKKLWEILTPNRGPLQLCERPRSSTKHEDKNSGNTILMCDKTLKNVEGLPLHGKKSSLTYVLRWRKEE